MSAKSFSYEIKGAPKPLGDRHLLKITEDGKITQAREEPAKPPQKVVLRLLSEDGQRTDIIKTVKYGGGPNTELKIVPVDRTAFFNIIDRISADIKLVKSLISDWRREALNYLRGGTSPVSVGFTSYPELLDACDPHDHKKAAAIISDLGTYFQDQIVSEHATGDDLEGIKTIDKIFVSKG